MDKTTVEQPDSEEEDNDFWGWNKKFFLPKVPKTTLLVHKCQRQYEQKGVFNQISPCKCQQLGIYLIALGFEKGYTGVEMHSFLQGAFYYQPHLRLPFEVLTHWIQLEIHVKNYEFAIECLVKPYIKKSNKFASNDQCNEETKTETSNNSRPWLRGQASKTFKMNNQSLESDQLPLNKEQYYELLELLVFHLYLPHIGMSNTVKILKNNLPMST